jgi:hypothetical protein
MAGRMAKYLATSLAIEKVVSEPRRTGHIDPEPPFKIDL